LLAKQPAGPDDLACMPYTSGTTGEPKGCMHTHRSVMQTAVGGGAWFRTLPEILRRLGRKPLVVDGRRNLGPDDYERYEGVGRRIAI